MFHAIRIRLIDSMFPHAPAIGNGNLGISPRHVVFERDQSSSEIVFVTDNDILNCDTTQHTNMLKVAWLLESPALMEGLHKDVKNPEVYEKFDLILTSNKNLIDYKPEKFILAPFGGSWVHPKDYALHKKSKKVSIIASPKTDLEGHKLRHTVIKKYQSSFNNIFGSNYQKLDNKVDGLKDYYYSVAIENCKQDYYFTEKLIDCFLTGTVPIYWGCPSIGDFFDTRGMICFDDADDLKDILASLSKEDYQQRLPYIKENFKRAQTYFNTEDCVYELVVKKHQAFKPYLAQTVMNPDVNIYPLEYVDYLAMDRQESRVIPWVAADGEEKHKYNYALTKDSIVFDIGGYTGEWAKRMVSQYDCILYSFEPVKKYYDEIKERLRSNKKAKIFQFGLAGSDRTDYIDIDGLASSTFKAGNAAEKIELKDIATYAQDLQIDLMKMNIEGGEYEILERLIETGKIINVKNLAIQFHDFAPDALVHRKRLQKQLSETHTLTYNYPFVWENWERL